VVITSALHGVKHRHDSLVFQSCFGYQMVRVCSFFQIKKTTQPDQWLEYAKRCGFNVQSPPCFSQFNFYLPTIISSTSDEFFRILLQISIVKIVELLLKMEVRLDISDDIITANIKPVKWITQ